MGLIWTILIGFLVGVVAKWIMPGEDKGGFIMTTLLGIGGAFVGSFLFGLLGFARVGFIGSVIGALVILWVGRKLAK